jgi:hypothetical protein
MLGGSGDTVVAIHQPNYLPWLGYFYKIASADVFVFLDDVQFSKNSYTNRVKILAGTDPRWLTVPVSFQFGDAISSVMPSAEDWPSRHLSTLQGFYAGAPAFRDVWPRIKEMFTGVPRANLAAINRYLVEAVCGELGIRRRFLASSDLPVKDKAGDDRLIALVQTVCTGGTYLSGRGASGYQDPEKFTKAGLGFAYTDFQHPSYEQGRKPFEPGLSILDPVFRLGWAGTSELLAASGRS